MGRLNVGPYFCPSAGNAVMAPLLRDFNIPLALRLFRVTAVSGHAFAGHWGLRHFPCRAWKEFLSGAHHRSID